MSFFNSFFQIIYEPTHAYFHHSQLLKIQLVLADLLLTSILCLISVLSIIMVVPQAWRSLCWQIQLPLNLFASLVHCHMLFIWVFVSCWIGSAVRILRFPKILHQWTLASRIPPCPWVQISFYIQGNRFDVVGIVWAWVNASARKNCMS